MTVLNDMVTLVQIGFDAYTDHGFEAHWIHRAVAPIVEECEEIDVP
jgi:hypothetical protein